MHEIQEKILSIAESVNLEELSYREIGKLIGVQHAQLVKHHLLQLQKKGYLKTDSTKNLIEDFFSKVKNNITFISIPILGRANCGRATCLAEEKIDGFLKINSRLLSKTSDVYALKAVGNSMNKANINGKNIEDGDYLIVQSKYEIPKANEYVVSIIDGCANVKKIFFDKSNEVLFLESESTEKYPPIVISKDDQFLISGKVVQVIKSAIYSA